MKYAFGFLAFFFLLAPSAHAATLGRPMNNLGLAGYWPLDGATTNWATGQTADVSGNGNTAQVLSFSTSTAPVAGKLGQAFKFDGTNDHVRATSMDNAGLPQTGAISFWIKGDFSTQNLRVVFDDYDQTRSHIFIRTYTVPNGLQIAFQNSSGYQFAYSSLTLENNVWQHVVVVWDTTNAIGYVYKNGVQLYVHAITDPAWVPSQGYATLGARYDGANAFAGLIDDVRIYNRPLAEKEVAALYKVGSANVGHTNTVALSNGLVGYWPLDGSTTNWATGQTTDASGNGNTGHFITLATSTVPSAGKIGQAFNINGVGYIDAGQITSLNGATAFTVSAWVKPNSLPFSGHQGIFGRGSSSGSVRVPWLWGNSGANGVCMQMMTTLGGAADGSKCATIDLTARVWNHVVYTWDGTNLLVYINNTPAGSDITTGHILSDVDTTTYIGYINAYAKWNGSIDDVRVYNRALSATEVSQLYNLGATSVAHSNTQTLTSGLVGYWTMDGSKINWATGQVQDSSGNGNTGQFVSLATSTAPTAGKIGQALKFNGSTSYIATASSNFPNPASDSYSVALWVKANDLPGTGNPRIFTYATDANNGIKVILGQASCPNRLIFEVKKAGTNYGGCDTSFGQISTNVWYHLVGTFDTTTNTVKLYINGINRNTSGFAGSLPTTFNVGYIGGYASTLVFLSGAIDDVKIYNRVLSAAEVQQLYKATK